MDDIGYIENPIDTEEALDEKTLLDGVEDKALRGFISELYRQDLQLSAEEEAELVKKLLEGSESAGKRLMEGNLRLAVSIAKQFSGRGVSFITLISECCDALVNLINRYSELGDPRFTNRASHAMRQACISFIAEASIRRPMRIPVEVIEKANKISSMIHKYKEEHGKMPSAPEVSQILGIDLDEAMNIMNIFTSEADEELVFEDEPELEQEQPFDVLSAFDVGELIKLAEENLTECERAIILWLTDEGEGCEKTYEEAAKHFGVTPQRIKQIVRKAARKLSARSRKKTDN